MSNPTSNFAWQMPTATDLVTDLPADFEVFGQAVDSSMADLLGGTAGQILAKNTNANMDFVWITNDVGDITAVTAGTGISGGGTSGAVTITNSMATEIAAKADLIVGTGAATFDNLTVGANGTVLTADSTVSPTGLKWATPSAAAFNGCRVTQSGGLSLANGTSQIQLFDTEAFDTNSYHSTVTNTGRMTVPSTGYYLLSFNSSYSSNGSGLRQTGIRKNGTVIQSATLSGSSVAQTDVVLSCILSATAGDYFDLELYQNSGTTLTVYGGTQSFFSISYLGA